MLTKSSRIGGDNHHLVYAQMLPVHEYPLLHSVSREHVPPGAIPALHLELSQVEKAPQHALAVEHLLPSDLQVEESRTQASTKPVYEVLACTATKTVEVVAKAAVTQLPVEAAVVF